MYQTCTLPSELHSYKRRTQDSNLQVLPDQRFSRPLPHHPDIRHIRAKRIELIRAGSKPAALPLRYAPITTGGRFELSDPLRSPAFQTGAFDHYAIRPLLLVPLPSVGGQWYDSGWIRTTGTLNPFNSLAGSRNRPTLPRCHITAPNLLKKFAIWRGIVSAAGLEPAVYGLEVRCILPLCYADIQAQ